MAQAIGIANGEIDEAAQPRPAEGGGGGGVLRWLNPWKTKEVEARGRGEEGRRALLSHALGVVAGAEPRVWFALRVEPSPSSYPNPNPKPSPKPNPNANLTRFELRVEP